jgi:hypothetical protein
VCRISAKAVDKGKVDALIQTMSKVPGVWVLDNEMDAD